MKGEFSKLTIMTRTIGDDFQMGLQNSLFPELNLQYLQEKKENIASNHNTISKQCISFLDL